jgi:hypothetical protein
LLEHRKTIKELKDLNADFQRQKTLSEKKKNGVGTYADALALKT